MSFFAVLDVPKKTISGGTHSKINRNCVLRNEHVYRKTGRETVSHEYVVVSSAAHHVVHEMLLHVESSRYVISPYSFPISNMAWSAPAATVYRGRSSTMLRR